MNTSYHTIQNRAFYALVNMNTRCLKLTTSYVFKINKSNFVNFTSVTIVSFIMKTMNTVKPYNTL